MAATSAAMLNGLGSPFLSGGKKSQALLPTPTGARVGGGAAAPRRFLWQLLLLKSLGSLLLKVVATSLIPSGLMARSQGTTGLTHLVSARTQHFSSGADPGAIAPFSFGSLLGTQLLLMGWVESKRWVDFFNPESQSVEWATPWSKTAENFANATGDQGYPGGKFFDPLSLAGTIKDGVYIPDTEKLERLKLAEIKHARLAMLAMLIFYFEAGQGKTPLGALGL
ncbi:hypothetical protein F0562_028955 [Nyssa sinensis]|uniref:Chlorophyll a-b binding protein, chloroplastic n=1 Tax=Nyssa sinensis TaxID=561372 RepID=A0A5J5B3T6_9ASTE|nr:hypothetical protein F0562_028955 [Nyssa sinensis]